MKRRIVKVAHSRLSNVWVFVINHHIESLVSVCQDRQHNTKRKNGSWQRWDVLLPVNSKLDAHSKHISEIHEAFAIFV